MTIDGIIVRQGKEQSIPLLIVTERPGFIGLRALNSPSTLYLPLGDLDYEIDETRRAQGNPEGTET